MRPVEDAKRATVPTVIIDSGLQTDSIVSFVATDNRKGGSLAADRLGELLNGKGKFCCCVTPKAPRAQPNGRKAFSPEIKAKFPGIELVSTDQYAGATRDTAKRASENLLNRFGEDVQGIFTPNESSTAGMLLALQDINKAGKVSFVGFDASQSFIDAMRAGQLHGIVVQNPFNMGYLGVRTMVDHLLGEEC